jgi:Flp pilus assembly protein TadD
VGATLDQARGFIAEGEHQKALDVLEEAARDFPSDPSIPMLLARVFRQISPGRVSPQLVKAAELGINDPAIQVRVGHLLLHEDDVDGARACAARAGELAQGDFEFGADLEGLIGRIAARAGNYELAETKLRSAVRQEPEYASHWIHLARFLWAQGRDEDSLAVLDEALIEAGDKKNLESLRTEVAGDSPTR